MNCNIFYKYKDSRQSAMEIYVSGEMFNFYLKDRTRKTRVEEIIPKG